MLKIKTWMIAICAFLLGFAANEHLRSLSGLRALSNEIEIPGHAVLNIQSANADKPVVSGDSGAQFAATRLPSPPPLSPLQAIQRAIENTKYDDAVHLLKKYLTDNPSSAQAWYLLAKCYQQLGQAVLSVDAFFRYVRMETDTQKVEVVLKELGGYLTRLRNSPTLYGEDTSWLIAQFEELLKYTASGGELHLEAALLALQINDNYQAQYHALMAVNEPATRKRAEEILAKINGTTISEEIAIPIAHVGNQFIIRAMIEGYPARLLLDTGASLSGLTSAYTARYPLLMKAKKPIQLNTAGGVQNSFLFTVNSISLSSLVFEQHILAQLPMDDSQAIDGLLGIDILGHFDFVIDQDASLLRLRPRK